MKLSLLFATALVTASLAAPAQRSEQACHVKKCCECDHDWEICVGNCNATKDVCKVACRCRVSNLKHWCIKECGYPELSCPLQTQALFGGIDA